MGYISNNNLVNYLPLSTTQPHLLLTQCEINGSNHHHQLINSSSGELGDRKNNLPTAGPSRWNPTHEQITALEEVYRRGTRMPTTEQIQEIASKLRKYGRIEGKNVFYWFQNQKARERLKRRRCEGDDDINNVREPLKDVKDSSSGGYRVDQTKSCPSFPYINPQPQKELLRENYNKDATWRNLVSSLITQEPGEIKEVEEEEEEETREIRTLNLFPVNQEKTDRFTENKNTKASRMCCNYCYYYDFMPLKKN